MNLGSAHTCTEFKVEARGIQFANTFMGHKTKLRIDLMFMKQTLPESEIDQRREATKTPVGCLHAKRHRLSAFPKISPSLG